MKINGILLIIKRQTYKKYTLGNNLSQFAFNRNTSADSQCKCGSIKFNIGHFEQNQQCNERSRKGIFFYHQIVYVFIVLLLYIILI